MIIKRVNAKDASLFDNVAFEVFDEPIRPDRLARYLSEPHHLMVIAEDGGQVIGQAAAVLHHHPDKPTELYVDELGVTPSRHRQGIGRRLLEELLAWGRELGCELTWIGTELDNIPARALYDHFARPVTFVMYEWRLMENEG